MLPMILFVSLMLATTAAMAWVVSRSLLQPAGLSARSANGLMALIWLGLALYFFTLRQEIWPTWLFWSMASLIGVLGLLFVAAVARTLLARLWPKLSARQSARSLLALTATALLTGLWQGYQPPSVVDVALVSPRWQGQPLTIVQLTDLHLGKGRGADISEAVVTQVNRLRPDLIAITGDLTDGREADVQAALLPLRQLQAPLGVFYVTGNHENYLPYTDRLLTFLSNELGWQVLMNAHVHLTADGGQGLQVVGLSDHTGTRMGKYPPNAQAAFAGTDPALPTLTLVHQPRQWPDVAPYQPLLTLMGHTHGGQIWPFGYLVRLVQPWVSGTHAVNGGWVHVSQGTGFWGPPMRLGTQAEITRLTLRAADSPVFGQGTDGIETMPERRWTDLSQQRCGQGNARRASCRQ